MKLSAHQLVRISGVFAICVSAFIRYTAPDSSQGRLFDVFLAFVGTSIWALIAEAYGFALVLWSLWQSTRQQYILQFSRNNILLVGLQSILMLCFYPERLYIVAAVVGMLFPMRFGIPWVLVQALSEALAFVLLTSKGFELKGYSIHTPDWWGDVAIIMALSLAKQLFSFSIGFFSASECRRRPQENSELYVMRALEVPLAIAADRKRVGRDLQETFNHHLTKISHNLQLASQQTAGKAREYIEESYLLARLLLGEGRSIVDEVCNVGTVNLQQALNTLKHTIHQPNIHLELSEGADRVEPKAALIFLRCSQDVMLFRRYCAQHLYLQFQETTESYRFWAYDDGHSKDNVSLNNDLINLEKLIRETGGYFTYESRANKVFCVEMSLPRRK